MSYGHSQQVEDLFVVCLHALISGRPGTYALDEEQMVRRAWEIAEAAKRKLELEQGKELV